MKKPDIVISVRFAKKGMDIGIEKKDITNDVYMNHIFSEIKRNLIEHYEKKKNIVVDSGICKRPQKYQRGRRCIKNKKSTPQA